MTEGAKITNLAYLKEMAGNDKGIIEEMIEIFIEQTAEFNHEILTHFESQNWSGLGSIAHKAKSSVRTMGMEYIGDCLEQLEQFSKGNVKFELQKKQEKGHSLTPGEQKDWNNVKNETKNDIELKHIPELVECFLTQCPLAVLELKENLRQL